MIRLALALSAISLLGACTVERSKSYVETQPVAPAPAAVAAPAGSTVITQTPATTTYTTSGSSTTVLR